MAVTTIKMTLEQFMRIPDNPRQRDTQRHAKKAVRGHLKKLSPTHSCVAVAAIDGVPVCKLDGHTRCYLWNIGKLESPASELSVSVFPVSSMKEAADLYTHFDSKEAVESSVDKLSGACRESGIVLTSQLLSGHNFNTALKFAHSLKPAEAMAEYDLMPIWAGVIKEVDSWDLPRNPFKGSGILSLMFLSVASRHFPDGMVEEFFTRYSQDLGEKNGRLRDGVQAMREHIDARRLANQMTGYENIFDMMSKGYSCLRAWADNSMITHVQPSREALSKLHAKARRNIDSGSFRINKIEPFFD